MFLAYWTICYGVLVLLGGVMGYVSKKSMPSLIAGAAFGLALIGSGFLTFQQRFFGMVAALVLTLLLTVFFGIRLKKTGKFMPAGMVLLLSLVTLVLLGMGFMQG